MQWNSTQQSKKNGYLIHGTLLMNLKSIMLSKEAQHKMQHIVLIQYIIF